VGAGPLFLRQGRTSITPLQAEIEQRLADAEPDLEVLLAEVIPPSTLRVFIDHPDGVTLELCERATMHLNDLRERYALEISSPGSERPLTKPAHFRRFVGQRARVRTRAPHPLPSVGSRGPRRPVRSFTGELVGATEQEVTLASDGALIAIPYSEIRRSNLIGE
jgi:ribosome maturation factor RimP